MSSLRVVKSFHGSVDGDSFIELSNGTRLNDTRAQAFIELTDRGLSTEEAFHIVERHPAVGDVWESRAGSKVAILKPSTIEGGGFVAVGLTRGSLQSDGEIGRMFVVDLTGQFIRIGAVEHHPLDLMRRVGRF